MIAALFAALLALPAPAMDLSDAVIDSVKALPAYQAAQLVGGKIMAGAPPVSKAVLAALPARNSARGGQPADPLTVIFLGSAEQVQTALIGAGWTQVPMGIRPALEKGLEDTFWHHHRPPNLPFSVFYLNGRREDMNWAMAENLNARHHFRLWKLPWVDDDGRQMWWGSGDYDLKIRLRDFSHVVDPDINAERLFIRDSLARSPEVSSMWMAFVPQVKGEMTNNYGYKLRTDGNVLFVGLTPAP